MTIYRKGTKVKIVSDNNNYDRFRGKTLKITKISKNRDDHPGYDEGLSPELLFDLETIDGT